MRQGLCWALRGMMVVAALGLIALAVCLGWWQYQSEKILEQALSEAGNVSVPLMQIETIPAELSEEDYAGLLVISKEIGKLRQNSLIPLEYIARSGSIDSADRCSWATAQRPVIRWTKSDRRPGPDWTDLKRETDLVLEPLDRIPELGDRAYLKKYKDPQANDYKGLSAANIIHDSLMLKALMQIREKPEAIPGTIELARRINRALVFSPDAYEQLELLSYGYRETMIIEQVLLLPRIHKELLERLRKLMPERDLILMEAVPLSRHLKSFIEAENLKQIRNEMRTGDWEIARRGAERLDLGDYIWWRIYGKYLYERDVGVAVANLARAQNLLNQAIERKCFYRIDAEDLFQKVYGDDVSYDLKYPIAQQFRGLPHAIKQLFHYQTAYDQARLALALETYRISNKHYPDSLHQLVPDYIATIPKDLGDGQDMKYRREGSRFVIYSIGIDGKDDGGKREPLPPAGRRVAEKDIVWPRIENTP